MGGIWRPGLVIGVTTYVLLMVVDLLVVAFLTPTAPFHQGLYQIEAARGYAHTPGFSGTVRISTEFSVTINSNGYRDREWTFDAPHRILVVGDSFTFGEPLPVEATIFSRLQDMFSEADAVFYNAGVSGYGIAQNLATLRKECDVVQPERVVYLFYLNDTSRDGLRTDPMTVADGWLVPAFDPNQWDRRLSNQESLDRVQAILDDQRLRTTDILTLRHITDVLRSSGLVEKGRRSVGSATPFETDDVVAYPPENTEIAASLLRAMAQSADACGAAFTMVILAADWEMRLGIREPATQKLLEAMGQDDIDILDLREPPDPGRILRLPNDNHYNLDAAFWAAERIANHLNGI